MAGWCWGRSEGREDENCLRRYLNLFLGAKLIYSPLAQPGGARAKRRAGRRAAAPRSGARAERLYWPLFERSEPILTLAA